MKAIEFCDVCFAYEEAGAFAIKNMNFSVEEGEFVAVLGHNGSGKSTLARLTNGLLSPDKGEIRVFGRALNDKNLFEIRKDVGVVFQNPDSQAVASLVEDDVAFGAENVGLPREEIGKRIDFALRAVGMENYRDAAISRLSGGQKQRVAIAGVLALKPRVIILDESTAMLDPRGRREIVDVVKKLNKEEGITVLLITHFMDEAILADRAVVLNRGELVMQERPEEIFKRQEELLTYSLALPLIGELCNRLREGGMEISGTLDAETLADELAPELRKGGTCIQTVHEAEREREGARIVAEHLNYVYNPKSPFAVKALNDVSATVEEGEFFGIIGHTGSGKSTFVRHLNGLIRLPSSLGKKREKNDKTVLTVGKFNLTMKKTDFRALRSKVGMVFQYPENQLFAETVFEDVAFGYKNFAEKKPSEEELQNVVREALEIVGLDFGSVKDASPFDLSGGQKRRAAIAGVIVTRPEILVLDEPAAGLDPLGKREIMELLHKLHESWCKTIVVVSHDMDEIAENCTRVAVFSEGTVKYLMKPKELFGHAEELFALGLDIPLTAKICRALEKRGIFLDCDFTKEDFLAKVLARKEGTC